MHVAALLALAIFMSAPEPLRIAVAPIVVSDSCKFAGPDMERTRGIMSQAAYEYLDKAFTATDIVFIDAAYVSAALEDSKIDFAKSKDRNSEKLKTFGETLRAHMTLVVQVEWTEQKNASPAAFATNPNSTRSTSKVRIRVWLHNTADNRLILDGAKSTFGGEAKSGYFGTVNPREMSGDPFAKNQVIQAEYRKRAQYLGRALVDALRTALKPTLGLQDPP